MEFIPIARQSEIPPGAMKRVVVQNTAVLVANVDGTYHAVSDRCPHLGARLSQGTLEDGVVTCPKHGAQIDLRTGQTVRGAQIVFLKMKVRDPRTYPVKVEGDQLLLGVEPGD